MAGISIHAGGSSRRQTPWQGATDRRRTGPGGASGFTVLELVFVVALVAIMAGITLPMTQSAVAMYRLETSSTILASKIAEARSEALKRNRVAWLVLDAAARTARVQTVDNGGAVVNVGGIMPLPPTVGFAGILGPTAEVRFDSMGRLVNPPQTVRVRSLRLGTERIVTIVVTGRVTIA